MHTKADTKTVETQEPINKSAESKPQSPHVSLSTFANMSPKKLQDFYLSLQPEVQAAKL